MNNSQFIAYPSYQYVYPPRPENKLPFESLGTYDNGTYIAQPKLNGDCSTFFTNGIEHYLRDRHNEPFKKVIAIEGDLPAMYRETIAPGMPTNKWMGIVGELMNKSKKNADGKHWNEKFVIHDIIVFDGYRLIGSTFEERVELLDKLYGKSELSLMGSNKTTADESDWIGPDRNLVPEGIYTDKYLYTTNMKNIYRVRSFRDCFSKLWEDLVKIDMYEGLILKRALAPLENGVSEKNNTNTMIKFRKPTRNYYY